jgi:hypothetical protein
MGARHLPDGARDGKQDMPLADQAVQDEIAMFGLFGGLAGWLGRRGQATCGGILLGARTIERATHAAPRQRKRQQG